MPAPAPHQTLATSQENPDNAAIRLNAAYKAAANSQGSASISLELARDFFNTEEQQNHIGSDEAIKLAEAIAERSQSELEDKRLKSGQLPDTGMFSGLIEGIASWFYNNFRKQKDEQEQCFILKSFAWRNKNEVGTLRAEIRELETALIIDKITELNQKVAASSKEEKVTVPSKETEKKDGEETKNRWEKLWKEIKELFSPDYNDDQKNSQANKIKGLYFLGQFDYSLLRVLKDALVFSIAGGLAIAALKVAVVIFNFAYQAIHANFLSIVEPANRYRFHITNMLFAGFFILFMLTISGAIPSIIPALPAISWLGSSINVLLANPWIALNYIIVELLGLRKMDMDLQTIVNDTFDGKDIGRAQINMSVLGNIGALVSSLLLVYALSGLALIAKVKVAVILVSVSTILSSLIFIFWSMGAVPAAQKSQGNNNTLLRIINTSRLSFAEIKAILNKELKKESIHEDMRVEEEAYISNKSNIFQKIWYMFVKSPSLRCFFGIIASCTAAITVIEIIWKGEVSSYTKTTGADYGSIMGSINSITSIGSILVGLLAGYAKGLSSRTKALAPPIVFAFCATFFTISIISPTLLPMLIPLLSYFSPGMLSIWFGAATVISAKWSKYTLFDAANSEAWKRIFGDNFAVAMKMWQQPIKGTTGKISKASAATLAAMCMSTGNPIILPIVLAGVVTTWYASASHLNPKKPPAAAKSSPVQQAYPGSQTTTGNIKSADQTNSFPCLL
jgi:ATP/ADP translocase